MAADIDSPSRQSRARERRVPSFRCKGDLHLSEQKRGRLFCEVILHILWLMSGKIGIVFRSDGVVLANLRFEDCSIESWSSGSIVEVENCTSSRITDTIQLHHVSFENNILIGSSGLAMRSPSCFELELIDFVFENNTCNGRCGVILSRQNRLRDVVVYRNKPFDSAKNKTTVFHAPPGSVTSVDRMKSSENRCSSIHVQEGSLDLSNSVFNRNLIAVNQSGAGSTFPTTAEESSTLVWERLLFELNEAQFGGAIIASRSNVTFSSNTFEANDVENGGVIYIKNSTLSVQKCDFTDGSAVYGGGIYATFSYISVEESSASNLFTTWQGGFIFAQACVIRMSGCSFSDNRAAVGGGVLACNRNCSFSDKRSEYSRNSADFGGAIHLESNSSGIIANSQFVNNNASTSGGACHVEDSALIVQECHFANGFAEYGGGINSFSSNISVTGSSASDLSADQYGGFLSGETSEIHMSVCSFSKNTAGVRGGVLACRRNCNFTDTKSNYSDNLAGYGGSINMKENTSGIITNCQFDKNEALTSGGTCYVQDSMLTVQGCRFAKGSAKYGGAIRAIRSDISIRKIVASKLSARRFGGFLYGEDAEIHTSDCSFSDNRAAERGGVFACRPNCSFTDMRSNYSSNSADYGGGISMMENSSGIITDCQFDNNNASTSGGTCYVQDSMLTVQGCRFAKGSAKYGGAIRAIHSDISVKDSSASDLSASQFGGFLSGEAAEIHMSDCSFSNNTAAERGGVIECAPNSNFTDMRSNYSSNSADYGGGISVKDNSSGIITDCQFDKNEALLYGGAAYVEDSILSVQECHFTNGSAEYGGGINSFSSVVSIWETDAFGHFASEQGGFISAQTRSTVNVTRSFIISGKSRQGGAIFLSESVFRVINTQISLCEAESDGGAIMGNHSSRLLCSGCTLINNNASRGGAIFFEYSSIESIFVQLDDTSVLNNSAEYGGIHEKADRKRVSHCSCVGGIQISAEVESILQNCRTEHGECGVAAVANTSLINNRATSAGGAVFIDTVAGLRLRCSDDINQRRLEFYSEKQWKTMKRLTSIDDICTSWKNNTAERYGPDVASSVSNVQKEITIDKTGVLSLVNGKNHTILNHRSGEQIPAITLTLVDELGQGPAVGESNEEIKAVMFSPDGFFIGNVTKPLGIEGANLSAVGFVQPGIYRVLIDFEGASLETFEITVEVKPCDIGEVLSRDGKFCESCNVASYNFSPEDDSECHPCPENGDCSSRVILPNRGYWHPTPCSEHIQRCLTTEGCDSDNREDVLLEITQDVLMCQFDEQYLLNYTEAQCREASTMFVC